MLKNIVDWFGNWFDKKRFKHGNLETKVDSAKSQVDRELDN